MNKQYVAPKSTVYNYIQPLTPLCASKEFGVGSSDEPNGGTTSSIWSNRLEQQSTQGGIWSHMDD